MQKMAWLAAAAMLASSGVVAAQTTSTTQSVPPGTVGTAGAPNFGQLMSSLSNLRDEIAKVQSLNGGSANNLRPVNVAQLPGSDATALGSAVAKNQTQLAALRTTLSRVMVTTSTNERISIAQFLADNKINVNQVVGADLMSGTLILFYQK